MTPETGQILEKVIKGLAIGGAVATAAYVAYRYLGRRGPQPGPALAIGDSITADGRYVRALGRMPGYSWTNLGVVGSGTAGMLSRFQQAVASDQKFGEVLVTDSVNDGERPAEQSVANLAEIARQARSRGARVVLVTSPPWRGYSRWTPAAQARQDAVREWILQGGGGRADAVVDTYGALEDPRRRRFLRQEYAAADQLHLSEAGQAAMARTIMNQAYGS